VKSCKCSPNIISNQLSLQQFSTTISHCRTYSKLYSIILSLSSKAKISWSDPSLTIFTAPISTAFGVSKTIKTCVNGWNSNFQERSCEFGNLSYNQTQVQNNSTFQLRVKSPPFSCTTYSIIFHKKRSFKILRIWNI